MRVGTRVCRRGAGPVRRPRCTPCFSLPRPGKRLSACWEPPVTWLSPESAVSPELRFGAESRKNDGEQAAPRMPIFCGLTPLVAENWRSIYAGAGVALKAVAEADAASPTAIAPTQLVAGKYR